MKLGNREYISKQVKKAKAWKHFIDAINKVAPELVDSLYEEAVPTFEKLYKTPQILFWPNYR